MLGRHPVSRAQYIVGYNADAAGFICRFLSASIRGSERDGGPSKVYMPCDNSSTVVVLDMYGARLTVERIMS